MNFASADIMKKHLRSNLPDMKEFQIVSVYLLGQCLAGVSTGLALGRLIISSWENKSAPVIVLENTILRQPVIDAIVDVTSNYAFKQMNGTTKLGIYFANVKDRRTKEELLQQISGKYRVWFISTD